MSDVRCQQPMGCGGGVEPAGLLPRCFPVEPGGRGQGELTLLSGAGEASIAYIGGHGEVTLLLSEARKN